MRREVVELHIQWQDEQEMSTLRLRVHADDPDLLASEFEQRGVHIANSIKSTPWGTRELALWDPDGNPLTFYRDLRTDE